MGQVNEQVVVITGSSTGFGRRAAERLAERGHRVFATMRAVAGHNRPHAEALRARASGDGLMLRVLDLDVTDEASVDAAVTRVVNEAGRIDALVNNAGVWGPGVLEAFTLDQWRQVFDVNVFGGVRVLRAALPHLRRQGHGLVLQISSLQGRFILPYSGPYVASKHAAEGMAETFRYEVAPYGVEVCVVEPYDYLTEMKDKAPGYAAADTDRAAAYGGAQQFIQQAYLTPDAQRSRDPEEVVEAIVRLVETPPGRRPLRTTVGNPLPQIEQINALADEMHRTLYPMIGLGHLLALGGTADLTPGAPAPGDAGARPAAGAAR
jgi:NAD(P)-dependent dehydrogenase (short-subunit alcohol dehydrogenase family)